MTSHARETEELVRCSKEGDERALEQLFSRHRERLLRMVRLRLHPRLRSRLDAADLVQEVYLEASRRLPDYLRVAKIPFFLWLRSLTGQKLIDLHRRHLGAQARDPRRETILERRLMPEATSAALAAQLVGTLTTPSVKLLRAEKKLRVREAVESMEPQDREILVLRHFEHLTNAEAAQELSLKESTASHRYTKALRRLKLILVNMTQGPAETWLK